MRYEPIPEHHMPYPEIVERRKRSRPYLVLDSNEQGPLPTNGMVDLERRELIVPFDEGGHPVSRHELAHVKWSPTQLPRVRHDPRVLLSVEDAKINMGLAHEGIPVTLSSTERAEISALAAKDIQRGDVAMFILRALASLGTNVEHDILAPAADAGPEIRDLANRVMADVRKRLERGRRRARGPVASFRVVRSIARDVARELEALGLLDKPDGEVQPVCGGCCFGKATHGVGRKLSDTERRAMEILGRDGPLSSRNVRPGRMRIASVPLDVVSRKVAVGRRRRWRPATEGSVIRWTHRHPIDGAIFRRPARNNGCTVLVDASGSMSLDAEKIDHILRDAPGATLVAMYSGKGEVGELRVVARNGKRAAPEHLEPYGGGNIVDVPALEWLARQGTPRIWISDGHATGSGDRSSPEIRRKCGRICRRANIRRVKDVEEAAKVAARR